MSSGIGAVTTQYLIDQGYHVFGSTRNAKDAERCQQTFGKAFSPLIFDVRNTAQIADAAAEVKSKIGDNNLVSLVNNAGIAISGPIQFIDSNDIQSQFDINVIGLINVTQAFLPLLGARLDNQSPLGRIINISSVAGTFTMPFQAPYSASKHAVESLTDAMRRELDIYGIKVISIRPGPIKSEIWHKELAKTKRYDNTRFERIWDKKHDLITKKERDAAPTINVATTILKAIEATRPRLAYIVYRNLALYYFVRWIPARWVDALIRRQMHRMDQ